MIKESVGFYGDKKGGFVSSWSISALVWWGQFFHPGDRSDASTGVFGINFTLEMLFLRQPKQLWLLGEKSFVSVCSLAEALVHGPDWAEWKFIVMFLKKPRQSKSLGWHYSWTKPTTSIVKQKEGETIKLKQILLIRTVTWMGKVYRLNSHIYPICVSISIRPNVWAICLSQKHICFLINLCSIVTDSRLLLWTSLLQWDALQGLHFQPRAPSASALGQL